MDFRNGKKKKRKFSKMIKKKKNHDSLEHLESFTNET